ncbi:T9SS type A sorting domain-containing protein [Candidatus Zixiibacteriota bacterium]
MVYRMHSFIAAFCLLFLGSFVLIGGELLAADGQPYQISVLDPCQAPYPPDIPLEAHYTNVLPGQLVVVGVHLKSGFTQGTGAFDLLLCYDQSVLTWLAADRGEGIADWEFFTYRAGTFGQDCDSVCPSGHIRLIGIRNINDGFTPPAGSEHINDFLAILTFYVMVDRSFLNMCARVGFCSVDCGDNVISDISGDELALAFPGQDDPEGFIITFGPDYDLEACLNGYQGEFDADSFAYFDPGYVCIIPVCDDRGDINLNGIELEIGDATLFSSYFIYGPGVWDPIWRENQILTTDINEDGIVTTVADLVTLVEIITNGAEGGPACRPIPDPSGDNLERVLFLEYSRDGDLVVSVDSPVDIGAAAFIFRHDGLEFGTPILSDETAHMTIGSSDRDGILRVLVYSMKAYSIDAGQFDLFTVPASGTGAIELVEAQFSDAYGNMLGFMTEKQPPEGGFRLLPNYPNPFNATTQIRFALPTASEWRLGIYNIIGQKVEEFSGHAAAGRVAVEWDARKAPSGMYFYRLTAGDFTNTRKMVLMK